MCVWGGAGAEEGRGVQWVPDRLSLLSCVPDGHHDRFNLWLSLLYEAFYSELPPPPPPQLLRCDWSVTALTVR